jgi:hypothetical protein
VTTNPTSLESFRLKLNVWPCGGCGRELLNQVESY